MTLRMAEEVTILRESFPFRHTIFFGRLYYSLRVLRRAMARARAALEW